MSDGRTEISVAYAMLAATKQKGDVATGWRMSPKVAVRVADYSGIQVPGELAADRAEARLRGGDRR